MTHPEQPGDHSSRPPQPRPPGPTPRWVKVSGLVFLILAVIAAVMLLSGHGPGQHLSGAPTSPAPHGYVSGYVKAGGGNGA